jgi:hypothetical protein
MSRTLLALAASFLLLAAAGAAGACPHMVSASAEPPAEPEQASFPSLIDRYWAAEADSNADEATLQAAYLAEEEASTEAMHVWMRSLAAGLVALVIMALVAVGLTRLSVARRPLAVTMLARRPVPSVVVFSLLSPMVPPLVLMHAERDVMPSPVLVMAAAGAALALSMFVSRRRLAAMVRWAVLGPLGRNRDGALVMAEVEAKKLVTPPGARGRMPWFVADLSVMHEGEAARVSLSQATVDERTARLLHRLASGSGGVGEKLTVIGCVARVPADAAGADPLCREAPTQPRLGRAPTGQALVTAMSSTELKRRLNLESAMLVGLFFLCVAAAGLALLS